MYSCKDFVGFVLPKYINLFTYYNLHCLHPVVPYEVKRTYGYSEQRCVIIIIIIIIIISFMQGIYTYIPETKYVPREYSVAAILLLLFMVLISLVSVLNLLCFYISTFRSMCAVPNMAVFCSSLTSYFPGMLLTYFQNDFETVPVAPVITGITFVIINIIIILYHDQ